MFKAGDVVVCIKPGRFLEEGKEYVIIKALDIGYVRVDKNREWEYWHLSRFKLKNVVLFKGN